MEASCEAGETEVFFWSGVLANEYHEEAEKLEPHDFSGLTLAAHHVPTKPLYHSHSINTTGGRKYDKKLMSQGQRAHQLIVMGKTDLTLI